MKVVISVIGCDDTTSICLELKEEERSLLNKIAEMITKRSTYECMPTMSIVDYDKKYDEDL